MGKENEWIVFNGEIIPAQTPVASASSRGLMYGDGAFETLRVYASHLFLYEQHLQRLRESLKMLGISDPDILGTPAFQRHIFHLLRKNNLLERDAILRIQVWRTGSRGYQVDFKSRCHYTITATKCPTDFAFPALAPVDIRRIPDKALPTSHKLSNGLNYIMAAREAAQQGMDDALMKTLEGDISETTIANVFWLKENAIFTPSEECDILPGITRQIVMHIINRHQSLTLHEGRYPLSHLMEAESVWLTNSVRELLPARRVGEKEFEVSHSIVSQLRDDFCRYRRGHLIKLKG